MSSCVETLSFDELEKRKRFLECQLKITDELILNKTKLRKVRIKNRVPNPVRII